MEYIIAVAAAAIYLFISAGSPNSSVESNYKELTVNSRFGHNETKVINNKKYTWVDKANVKIDDAGVIRDDRGRPYKINSACYIVIDTQKVNQENSSSS